MAELTAYRYRAFISYSHADASWAKWLHRALESFRIDKDLVGRETEVGTVPKTLRPIFRDRDDFTAGHSLTDQTLAALDASAALVVICSPAAAKSAYVTEEIRLFKTRHPDRPVVPLIVDGTPDDPARECFPPSLKFKLTGKGQIGKRKAELLAADAREEGDGKALALAKVVAALLGLSSDDVYRRAERDRRRKGRLRGAIAAVIAVLVLAGGYLAVESYQKQRELDDVAAVVAKYSAAAAESGVPGAEQNLIKAITAIAEGATDDPRKAKAFELLRAGNPEAAIPLLEASAELELAKAKRHKQEAAESLRNLGAIAGFTDTKKARDYYAKAARLDPGNADGMIQHGWHQFSGGSLDAAKAAFERALTSRQARDDRALQLAAHRGLASLYAVQGETESAEKEIDIVSELATALAREHPDEEAWQYELAKSQLAFGYRLKYADIDQELAAYRSSAQVLERLATKNPGNIDLKRSLADALNAIAETLIKKGNLAEARTTQAKALAIARELAIANPQNPGLQSELAQQYIASGYIANGQNRPEDALEAFRKSVVLMEALVEKDSSIFAHWLALGSSYRRVSEALRVKGDMTGALKALHKSLEIFDRMTEVQPNNLASEEVAVDVLQLIGDIHIDRVELSKARHAYEDALKRSKRLLDTSPENALYLLKLYLVHVRIGASFTAEANFTDALETVKQGHAIAERIAKLDPANVTAQHALATSYKTMADTHLALGDPDRALKSLETAEPLTRRLAEADPSNAGKQQLWFGVIEGTGDVYVRQGDLPKAMESYQKSLAERARKTENAAGAVSRAQLHDKIGDVHSLRNIFDQALASYEESLAIYERLFKIDPNSIAILSQLAREQMKVGGAMTGVERTPEAMRIFRDALENSTRVAKAAPDNAEMQQVLSANYQIIGIVLASQQDWSGASEAFENQIAVLSAYLRNHPDAPLLQYDLAASHTSMGDVFAGQAKISDALDAYRTGCAIMVDLTKRYPNEARFSEGLATCNATIAKLEQAAAEQP